MGSTRDRRPGCPFWVRGFAALLSSRCAFGDALLLSADAQNTLAFFEKNFSTIVFSTICRYYSESGQVRSTAGFPLLPAQSYPERPAPARSCIVVFGWDEQQSVRRICCQAVCHERCGSVGVDVGPDRAIGKQRLEQHAAALAHAALVSFLPW